MALTTASFTTAAPAKRWVRLVRTFVGSTAKVGDVVELEGRFAAELIAANKVVPAAEPVVAVPAPAPRKTTYRRSKES